MFQDGFDDILRYNYWDMSGFAFADACVMRNDIRLL